MPVNVVSEWLNACSGCEISILNTGEALLDLLPHLNFVHIPALVDHKYFGQLGDGTTLEIPEAVVGIVSGGVRNTEHEHVPVSYTHLRAHETRHDLVCRLLLEKKK